jgi:NADPH-dependent 2,4-dienoyl-CoA reductase/sulfur reductase-like enzyme
VSGAPEKLLVVGASLAGLRVVEEARALGFGGQITLVGAESHLPYDRPPLSKEFLDGGTDLKAPHFPGVHEMSDTLGVDVRLGSPATHLDVEARTVSVGAEVLSFDALVIATGATPRRLPDTTHLRGVHTLRTLDDARAIRGALDDGARTVVIGAGFIGAEIASAARKRGLEVTVIESMPIPLVRAVGTHAGSALADLHRRHGTDLRCAVSVEGLVGEDHVTGVRISDGTVLPADLVVVGIGAEPATGWLEGSGLLLDNGIVCDSRLQAAPGIWAVGDVARWLSPDFDTLIRLEHWTNAGDQGMHVAGNATNPANASPFHHVPYFWSDWYGQRIQFAGLPQGDPVVVSGGWDEESFTALYGAEDRLVGVLTLNRRGDVMKYRGLIARRGSWADALALAARRNAAASRSA